MMKTLNVNKVQLTAGYETREETLDGKVYLVVPVVMMVEGVHNGSRGAILHPIAELGKYPASWDGIPVMINHPQDEDNNFVSANSPAILESSSVGKIFNTHVDGLKLKAEAWLDPEKLAKVSPEAQEAISNHGALEVSVGVFTDDTETPGEWNGEKYSAIATNHRPDHLALLPGGQGACSVEDGCGIRANSLNKKGGNEMVVMEILQTMKTMNEAGFGFTKIAANEDGYRERMDSVRTVVNGLDTEQTSHYMEELFDTSVVYSKYDRNGGGEKLMKQSYSYNDGAVQLVGEAVEVRKKVEYTVVAPVAMQRTKFNKDKKEVITMGENEKCTPCIEKKVNALIANKLTAYTEDDKEWLQGLEESQLDKMIPAEPEVHEVVKEVPATLSKEEKDALEYGKRQLAANRKRLMDGIKANTAEGLWSDETLAAMDDSTLERVHSSVYKEQTDYSLNAGKVIEVNAAAGEPLYPTGVEIENKK